MQSNSPEQPEESGLLSPTDILRIYSELGFVLVAMVHANHPDVAASPAMTIVDPSKSAMDYPLLRRATVTVPRLGCTIDVFTDDEGFTDPGFAAAVESEWIDFTYHHRYLQ